MYIQCAADVTRFYFLAILIKKYTRSLTYVVAAAAAVVAVANGDA